MFLEEKEIWICFPFSFSPEPPMNSSGNPNGFDTQSDVYRMLQDYEEPVSAPKQSGSFKYLQGILEAEDGGQFYLFISLSECMLELSDIQWLSLHYVQRNIMMLHFITIHLYLLVTRNATPFRKLSHYWKMYSVNALSWILDYLVQIPQFSLGGPIKCCASCHIIPWRGF